MRKVLWNAKAALWLAFIFTLSLSQQTRVFDVNEQIAPLFPEIGFSYVCNDDNNDEKCDEAPED